jgi:hypothetical protein
MNDVAFAVSYCKTSTSCLGYVLGISCNESYVPRRLIELNATNNNERNNNVYLSSSEGSMVLCLF